MGRRQKQHRSHGDIAACDEDIIAMEKEALNHTDVQSRKRRRSKNKMNDSLEARQRAMTGVDLLGFDVPTAKRQKTRVVEFSSESSNEGPSKSAPPPSPQLNGHAHLNGTPKLYTNGTPTPTLDSTYTTSSGKKQRKNDVQSKKTMISSRLNGLASAENGLNTSISSNRSAASSTFIELNQLIASSTPKITLLETKHIAAAIPDDSKCIVTTPSDEEQAEGDQFETADGASDSTITNGIDIDESSGAEISDEDEVDDELADFVLDDQAEEVEGEDDDEDDDEEEEEEEVVAPAPVEALRRSKRAKTKKEALASLLQDRLSAYADADNGKLTSSDEDEDFQFNAEDEDDDEQLEEDDDREVDVEVDEEHMPIGQADFFAGLRSDDLSSGDDDDDYEMNADYDEEEEGEIEDDQEVQRPGYIDAEELNDLLEDIDGIYNDADDDIMDESDAERYTFLDPEGAQPKNVILEIPHYEVKSKVPEFVSITYVGKQKNRKLQQYELFGFSEQDEHSVNTAAKAMRWLIEPIGVQSFFEQIYSKRAVVIHRQIDEYYLSVFSSGAFFSLFQQNPLCYGQHVNVASYKDGVRTTHNPEGRAYAGAIRTFIDEGKSIQCVNPQSYNPNLHYICEVLSELFNCFVGANCYFTPAKSAGFAPHYDDIDAFIIQCEGRKKWTIHAPDADSQWPPTSSENFTPQQMESMADRRVWSGWLEEGDMLYLPRGYIHSARTGKGHSLHVTISVAQEFSYRHLLKEVVKLLLDAKADSIPRLRSNLPINPLDICGVADTLYENEDQYGKTLERPIELFLSQFLNGANEAIPPAIDQIAKKFMRKALPPLLTSYERALSIHSLDDEVPEPLELHAATEVRLIRKHAQRLLFESEERAFLIHRMANSMLYEGAPEVQVDVPQQLVSGVEKLMKCYPDWTSVSEISKSLSKNLAVVQLLYDNGLLMIRNV